jgi:MoaD family protein
MKINFYATFRQVVGGKTVDLPLPENVTVRQLLDEIIARYPKLRGEMLDEHGKLYHHVHILINGRDFQHLAQEMETVIAADDTVNIFPPVAGG